MAKSKTQPDNEHKQAEIEYKSITSFYERILYASFTVLGVLGTVTAYFTYQDRQAMIQERNQIISMLKDDIKVKKDEWKENIKDIKDEMNEKLNDIKEDTDLEIVQIKKTTNQTAIQETRQELRTYFESDKVKNMLENEAVMKVRDKVIEIVDTETKNFSIISDAASLMRTGEAEGLHTLIYYSKNLNNPRDREKAKQLLNNISNYYYILHKDDHINTNIEEYYKIFNIPVEQRNKNNLIEYLVKDINTKNNYLFIVSSNIMLLSKVTGQDFKPFELDKINNWYEEWKKNNKM